MRACATRRANSTSRSAKARTQSSRSPPPPEAGSGKPRQDTLPDAGPTLPTAPQGLSYLLLMCLFAVAGGLILNLMPCVFPVLSLKVLSLAGSANSGQRERLVHGLAYTAGVVLSFLAVAGLLLVLRGGGAAVGWGFHLQAPWFVALLAYLFLAMGLSLSGLIEFGAGLMGTGQSLAARDGVSGSFFTGVLAAVVASPCTAPFMGSALGFAMTQSAPLALLSRNPALLDAYLEPPTRATRALPCAKTTTGRTYPQPSTAPNMR